MFTIRSDLRILFHMPRASQLGEGGYAFVYLAESVTQDRAGSRERVAIKRVLAGSADRLAAARCEIEVLCALRHPNCLQLLDHAVLPCGGTGGVIGSSGNTSTSGSSSSNSSAAGWEVLLVTPAYEV
jgi:serine/threonine protein kinase